MKTVQEIYEFLDTVCPYSLAEPWDNAGLNVGYRTRKVQKVLIALDLTMQTILAAKEKGCELIITHHPLLFDATKQINSDTAEGRRVMALAANNIAHIACHTNLDAAEGGVNDVLAELCGLKNVETFCNLGRIGTAETTLSALAERLKAALHTDCCQAVCVQDAVGRVAVVGGAGGSFLEEPFALQAGDTFVTGEAKHHQLLIAKEQGFNLLILGHYETEYPVLTPLKERLEQAFPDITFELMPLEHPTESL